MGEALTLQQEFEAAGFTVFGRFDEYSDSVTFTTYSTDVCDNVETSKGVYHLDSDIDVTDDDEHEQGLSYSKVRFIKRGE